MPSPPTHQDSPKVPEEAVAALRTGLLARDWEEVEVNDLRAALAEALPAIFSALLSDEVVDRLACRRFEAGYGNPDGLPWREAHARDFPVVAELRDEAKRDLQAAIDQVGGKERG